MKLSVSNEKLSEMRDRGFMESNRDAWDSWSPNDNI